MRLVVKYLSSSYSTCCVQDHPRATTAACQRKSSSKTSDNSHMRISDTGIMRESSPVILIASPRHS